MKSKKEFFRLVKNIENEIIIDITGKINCRGAYICKNVECVNKVRKAKKFQKVFKMLINNELYDALIKEIEEINKFEWRYKQNI